MLEKLFKPKNISFKGNKFTLKGVDKGIAKFLDLITDKDVTVRGSTVTFTVTNDIKATELLELFKQSKIIK